MLADGQATRATLPPGIAARRFVLPHELLTHPVWAPGALGALGLAAIVTGVPVMLHLAGQGFGVVGCVLLGLLLTSFAAPAVPIVLLFSLLFQNLVVALVSSQISTIDQFNSIRAYSFILTVVVWTALVVPYWLRRERFAPHLRTLINVTTIALLLIGVYFVLGAASNPSAAIVYLRNIATPILLFQIFVLVAYRYRLSLTNALAAMAIAALVYGYVELLAHDDLFRLVNGDGYLNWRMKQDYEAGVWLKELQEKGLVIRSYLDTMVIDFLNTPLLPDLGLRLYRIVGPNFHPISYAYALAFFSVVLAAAGRWWCLITAFPLLITIGSKGALVFVVLVVLAILSLLRLRRFVPIWVYSATLLAYVASGIVTGLRAQDYHVIGFIGGLNGFIGNPLGRGIGVGGNLSLDMAAIDWSKSQYLGHTDVAVESAVGVLLYQMGIFGLLVLGVFVWIALELWKWHLRSGGRLHAAAAFAILAVTANGIFHEEAMFAPLALGVVLAFGGLLLGRAHRVVAADASASANAA